MPFLSAGKGSNVSNSIKRRWIRKILSPSGGADREGLLKTLRYYQPINKQKSSSFGVFLFYPFRTWSDGYRSPECGPCFAKLPDETLKIGRFKVSQINMTLRMVSWRGGGIATCHDMRSPRSLPSRIVFSYQRFYFSFDHQKVSQVEIWIGMLWLRCIESEKVNGVPHLSYDSGCPGCTRIIH